MASLILINVTVNYCARNLVNIMQQLRIPGFGGFMGYGDLWGFIFTGFIYNKSMLGFMGIYG